MAKNKHLTLDDRTRIATSLNNRDSFKAIGRDLGKDCTTIAKEVKAHLVFQKTGGSGMPYNACLNRRHCSKQHLCSSCTNLSRYSKCSLCRLCNDHCPDFVPEVCPQLEKAPYVCNGCPTKYRCTLEKRFYQAAPAHEEYRSMLSESRQGLSITEEEIKHLDSVISPKIMKKQSIHHICMNNKDSIMVSESTVYRLVDYNLLTARNIDLPRKVRSLRARFTSITR